MFGLLVFAGCLACSLFESLALAKLRYTDL